ncbi:MAG TPA: hypothetical protein ENJ98_02865 [Thiolapillus brandeum]|uniref:Transporter n=1 Tax=Thiolapillus brandeum TaxID=1076588 RepID=A0A7C5IYU7_9GAMM|nr:hypothetical protein [Thiolapillus brandeum]
MKPSTLTSGGALIFLLSTPAAWGHDPIFGIGPHVLYKGGVEIAVEGEADKAGSEKEQALTLELTYGLTGDWAAGAELPYAYRQEGSESNSGNGDVALFTKYRFWRRDSLGLQESAAVLLKVVTDTADGSGTPRLDKGATDTILGLTYGYEGRRWYRWAGIRYRFNGKNDAGLERGDRVLLDFVGGYRPRLTGYREPDTVWLLELNGEYGKRASLHGSDLPDTGGTEWFLSPGLFWTRRNFAVKAGVQVPIYSNLNGDQDESDYRAKVVLEWHL